MPEALIRLNNTPKDHNATATNEIKPNVMHRDSINQPNVHSKNFAQGISKFTNRNILKKV